MTQRKRKDTTHDAQCEAALPDSEGTSGSDHTPPPLTPRPPTPTQQTHSFSLNASNARSHTLNKRASENVLSTNDLAKNISSPPPLPSRVLVFPDATRDLGRNTSFPQLKVRLKRNLSRV